ncbi:MAG TPA: ABC transporter substrate-binding protein, partial [Thermomicrobiales bacterium]|nr:ABC transporter substrate-binding protein [Thermomicrobiales bacterium]
MTAQRHSVQRFVAAGFDRRTVLKSAGAGLGLIVLRQRPASAQDGGQQLVIGANFVIQSLDPGRSIETTTNMINHAAYDALVTFDGEDLATPKPLLATKWTISDDGTTYTFTLRPDVKFVSGNPLTSADVKWSFDRVQNLQSNPAFLVEKVASVEAPDPQTVVVKLSSPYPAILPILSSPSLGIVDSKLVEQHGGKAGTDAKDADTAEPFLNGQSAGSGSYTISSYVPDQEVVLVKNSNYWRGAPAFDRIVIRNIIEAATQKLQLEAGDIDIATGLSQDQIAAMQSSADVTTKGSPAATTFYVLMNNDKEIGGPFANPLIQQAVRAALKYDEILALVGGGAVRLAGIIPTNFPGSLPASDAMQTGQAKARSLSDQAALGTVSGALSYTGDSTIWGVQTNIL